ncbi:MAG: hypothetical protein JWN56_1062 [Sphingobacteriales bacterium]|nr:hypothetical protein [Sphingobacteriales bacterium]
MFRKAIFIITLFALFASCKVQWVPDYNAEMEAQISAGAKMTDKLYLDLLDTTVAKRAYSNYSGRYTDIESEINSILLKNEARNKNADFLVICNNLKKAFLDAKSYHKQHQSLVDAEAKLYQAYLAGFWRPLYLSERGLKPKQ